MSQNSVKLKNGPVTFFFPPPFFWVLMFCPLSLFNSSIWYFYQRQDLCSLFDSLFSSPGKKKKKSCRNISASYKGLQDWFSEDLSPAEAQVGVTQHHKEGRFGPSSLHLGKYLVCNDYRSRLIFPSLILCHKETSQKQMFILLSWSTRYFSNAYRICPLTHFYFHFRQYHLYIMQYTLHGLNFF